MPPRIDSTSPAPLYDYSNNLSDAYVVQGETNLRQIADKLHLDPDALAEANPQIKDGKVLPLQTINLPLCSAAPAHAGDPVSVVSNPAGHGLPKGPVGDPVAASATKAILNAAAPAAAKSDVDAKAREATSADLIKKAAAVPGMGPYDITLLGSALGGLPASEFNRQAARIGEALKTGNAQQVMYAVEEARAATHAIDIRGGGKAIQARVEEHGDGYHFAFDRPMSKDQAVALIFQGGKVPDRDRL